ncbi:YusU family protein [Bacillus cereus]|uniref:YusU family protein n=1 Tax=Bacillus cereus TaxID=1396 RepID=UPI003980948C
MSEKFNEQFDGLLEKYTELLLGESNEERKEQRKEQVQKWALYSYIAKTMPALVKHWNETYPDAKEEMVQLITDIKRLNEEKRNEQ